MDYRATLLMTEFVTHDVCRYIVERPPGFDFEPGQAVMMALDRPGWAEVRRSFTPTSLPRDRVLEFTIKTYPAHQGLTRELAGTEPGAEVLLSRPFGTLTYRGPGTFIAGGAGITPFLAMLRDLARRDRLTGHRLIYANRKAADIITAQELRHNLGEGCHFLCSKAGGALCDQTGLVDRDYLARMIGTTDQAFYVCGPPGFVDAVNEALGELGAGAEQVLFES
ncbi:FAD-binding oxidoreductase [Thiohalorhabdus sp.]|uniref:FAD-binding oxidoreductase n=1 Tax=Thiohalorhabdus sp. TaxID=3094134 RepID=UPI002FC2BC12